MRFLVVVNLGAEVRLSAPGEGLFGQGGSAKLDRIMSWWERIRGFSSLHKILDRASGVGREDVWRRISTLLS